MLELSLLSRDQQLLPRCLGHLQRHQAHRVRRGAERIAVGVTDTETFFSGNFGGGIKYHFGRWGVRGDYRAFAIRAKDAAPAFFGSDE